MPALSMIMLNSGGFCSSGVENDQNSFEHSIRPVVELGFDVPDKV